MSYNNSINTLVRASNYTASSLCLGGSPERDTLHKCLPFLISCPMLQYSMENDEIMECNTKILLRQFIALKGHLGNALGLLCPVTHIQYSIAPI